MKRKHILLFIVLICIIAVIGVKAYLETNLKNLVEMPISDINLTEAEDGIYTGSYKSFPVEAVVKVEINSHKITDITLVKHVNGQGTPAEIIPKKVVEAQSLEVDMISGATYSSKIIAKAIENALISASK